MPDDFDYSRPVNRNRVTDGSTPVLTIGLIALCVLLTVVFWIAPKDDESNSLYKIVHLVLLSPDQIWSGRYLGLVTSFFIHLDVMHIAFNMLWIWKMGSTLENTVAPWKYVLFMVMGTAVGSCCELLVSGQTGAGASGAGYALMGLFWGGRGFHESWRQLGTRENMRLFLMWGVFCIFMTVTHVMSVANGAHFGGLLFGLAVGYLFFSPQRKPLWIPALIMLLGLCVVSLTWVPWTSTWNWYKGSQAYDRHHYKNAVVYYERSLRTGGARMDLMHNLAISWLGISEQAEANNRPEEAQAALKKYEALEAESNAQSPPVAASEDSADDSKGSSGDDLTGRIKRDVPPSKK